MGVVIIPFGYEDLPEDRRKMVVPICIEAEDRDGNVIDPVWFEQGVAPISRELTALAQTVLGDKRMVSDIAQPSVHKSGTGIGTTPARSRTPEFGARHFGKRETWPRAAGESGSFGS